MSGSSPQLQAPASMIWNCYEHFHEILFVQGSILTKSVWIHKQETILPKPNRHMIKLVQAEIWCLRVNSSSSNVVLKNWRFYILWILTARFHMLTLVLLSRSTQAQRCRRWWRDFFCLTWRWPSTCHQFILCTHQKYRMVLWLVCHISKAQQVIWIVDDTNVL